MYVYEVHHNVVGVAVLPREIVSEFYTQLVMGLVFIVTTACSWVENLVENNEKKNKEMCCMHKRQVAEGQLRFKIHKRDSEKKW